MSILKVDNITNESGDGPVALPYNVKFGYKTITGHYTAVVGDKLFVDNTINTFNITLPIYAEYGNEIEFFDPKGVWINSTPAQLLRNGHLINGQSIDLIIDDDDGYMRLVYFGSTQGWRVY